MVVQRKQQQKQYGCITLILVMANGEQKSKFKITFFGGIPDSKNEVSFNRHW
jgi:hypothetical protein